MFLMAALTRSLAPAVAQKDGKGPSTDVELRIPTMCASGALAESHPVDPHCPSGPGSTTTTWSVTCNPLCYPSYQSLTMTTRGQCYQAISLVPNLPPMFDDPLNGGNEDGRINASDEMYGSLRLWLDADHNGRTDAGELILLASVGLTEIELDYTDDHAHDDKHGNTFRYSAPAHFADGRSVLAWVVFFNIAARGESRPWRPFRQGSRMSSWLWAKSVVVGARSLSGCRAAICREALVTRSMSV